MVQIYMPRIFDITVHAVRPIPAQDNSSHGLARKEVEQDDTETETESPYAKASKKIGSQNRRKPGS